MMGPNGPEHRANLQKNVTTTANGDHTAKSKWSHSCSVEQDRLHTPFSSAVLGIGKKNKNKKERVAVARKYGINAKLFKGEKIFETFGSKTHAASNYKKVPGWLQPEKLNFPLRFLG